MLLYVIWGIYFLFLGLMIYGWWSKLKPTLNTEEHSIGVIVPLRNEAKNLEKLVGSLEAQAYQKFEVIFVNDHSKDDSSDIIKRLVAQTELVFDQNKGNRRQKGSNRSRY